MNQIPPSTQSHTYPSRSTTSQSPFIPIENVPELILNERNTELQKLSQDLTDLLEIQKQTAQLVGNQGEQITDVEARTEYVFEETILANDEIQKADKSVRKKRKFAIFLTGAAIGGTIGAMGFLVNPLLGVATVIALSSLGGGIGKVVSKKSE